MASPVLENTIQVPAIPSALESDSDEVTLSLETARALGETGDLREALRWLRRAADAAEQTGDDLRAVTLARAAADLTSRIGGASLPPPLPQQPADSRLPAPPPPSARASGTLPRVEPTPPSLRPPPPSARAQTPARQTKPPPKPSIRPARTETPPAPSVRPKPTGEKPLELVRKPPESRAFDELETSTALEKLVASGRAVRVSIKRSSRDKSLYVVRRLTSGKLPFGSREAVVVLIEADPSLFSDDGDD
jgi:hypothetical protein